MNEDAYYVSFELHETSRTTGATIKAIELDFQNGLRATFGPEVARTARVPPGGTVPVSGLNVTGMRTARPLGVQIRVLLTDDNGADSISGAATGITGTYRVSGRITEAATGRVLPGAVVAVTFGAASGRTATSDAGGSYLLRQIPVGTVSFNISAPGFMTGTRTAFIESDTVVDVALARVP